MTAGKQGADRPKPGPGGPFRNLKDRPLRLFDDLPGVVAGLVRARQHPRRGVDHLAEFGPLAHDPPVVLHVRGARHAVQ
jgi:hypothetical protein